MVRKQGGLGTHAGRQENRKRQVLEGRCGEAGGCLAGGGMDQGVPHKALMAERARGG